MSVIIEPSNWTCERCGSVGPLGDDSLVRHTCIDGIHDAVNSPPHYIKHPMECIDAIRVLLTPEEFRGFCLGNWIKYRWRRGEKNDADQDMAKGLWYLRKALED